MHACPLTGPNIFGLQTALLCIPPDIPQGTDYCFCPELPSISKTLSDFNNVLKLPYRSTYYDQVQNHLENHMSEDAALTQELFIAIL